MGRLRKMWKYFEYFHLCTVMNQQVEGTFLVGRSMSGPSHADKRKSSANVLMSYPERMEMFQNQYLNTAQVDEYFDVITSQTGNPVGPRFPYPQVCNVHKWPSFPVGTFHQTETGVWNKNRGRLKSSGSWEKTVRQTHTKLAHLGCLASWR